MKESRGSQPIYVKARIVVVLIWLLIPAVPLFSQDTPEAILQRGLYLSDLYNWTAARPYLIKAKQLFESSGDKRNALYADCAAIRAGADPIPMMERSYQLAQELAANPILQSDKELRMFASSSKAMSMGRLTALQCDAIGRRSASWRESSVMQSGNTEH